jgi:PTH1 family peptidyl-tRNA hydrolase
MKYLIVGLGNIGKEYDKTRHNIGFDVLDALAEASNAVFANKRYGEVAEMTFRGRKLVLLKPSTYMNLSGNAINYWLQAEKLSPEKLLVIVDDIALPFGTIKIKGKGSSGGHNGLKHIEQVLGSTQYARLRFGIGSDFPQGYQMEFVLSKWDKKERELLVPRIAEAVEAIKSYVTVGLERTMNIFNTKPAQLTADTNNLQSNSSTS